MKNLLVICTLLLLISCGKENPSNAQKFAESDWDVKNVEVSVIQDCTATYLTYRSKNYILCNHELVEKYNTGAKVRVSFRKVERCTVYSWAACYKGFLKNEGEIYAAIH